MLSKHSALKEKAIRSDIVPSSIRASVKMSEKYKNSPTTLKKKTFIEIIRIKEIIFAVKGPISGIKERPDQIVLGIGLIDYFIGHTDGSRPAALILKMWSHDMDENR